MSTYKEKLDEDRDIEYVTKLVDGVRYVQVWDGQYCWATPKSDWDRVVDMPADESRDDDDSWYSEFCQRLTYDAAFCKAHQDVFGEWNWA